MPLQLGLLHRDGRPATPEDLTVLLGPWGARATEIAGERLDGPLALAYRGDRLTPEDECDVQPLCRNGYVLTWDGRLDNREDLARRLGLAGTYEIPDAALVLDAYVRLGDALVAELVGEFGPLAM